MARIRSVNPSICISDDMADLDARYERTYVRLWTHLDDEGRGRADPRLIKAAIYPLHDAMTPEEVLHDLDTLVGAGLLVRYEADGVGYIHCPTWHEYQKPNRPVPSKLPAPPAQLSETNGAGQGVGHDDSLPTHEQLTEHSVRQHEQLTPGVGDGEGVGGGDVDGGGEGSLAPTDVAAGGDSLRIAVYAACGIDGTKLTPSASGAYGKALADLRAAGATPGEIPAATAKHRLMFSTDTITPSSLARHWPQIASGPAAINRIPSVQSLGRSRAQAGVGLADLEVEVASKFPDDAEARDAALLAYDAEIRRREAS